MGKEIFLKKFGNFFVLFREERETERRGVREREREGSALSCKSDIMCERGEEG